MNKTSIELTGSRTERGLLPVVLLSLALVVAAVPALNVALPNVAADTGASLSQLQWIVDAYALVFAGLLLPAGALGDRYGRKPVLVLGLAVFALGSAAASFTGDPETLMVLRGVMGVGAALVMPTTLSIITSSFPADMRGRAVGAWVGVAGRRRRLRSTRLRGAAGGLGLAVGVPVQRRRGGDRGVGSDP